MGQIVTQAPEDPGEVGPRAYPQKIRRCHRRWPVGGFMADVEVGFRALLARRVHGGADGWQLAVHPDSWKTVQGLAWGQTPTADRGPELEMKVDWTVE